MHGLFRVRGFTQDDGHIFCLPDQMAAEIKGVLDLTQTLLSTFGFTQYEVNLSTKPDKAVGSDEIWATAEDALREALGLKGWDYVVDQVGGPGGGVSMGAGVWCEYSRNACTEESSCRVPLGCEAAFSRGGCERWRMGEDRLWAWGR
jgi:hypothetical protein